MQDTTVGFSPLRSHAGKLEAHLKIYGPTGLLFLLLLLYTRAQGGQNGARS